MASSGSRTTRMRPSPDSTRRAARSSTSSRSAIRLRALLPPTVRAGWLYRRPSPGRARSMAGVRAAVDERADRRTEPPGVGAPPERQLEDAEARVVTDLTVLRDAWQPSQALAARPDDELADPSRAVDLSARTLRCEALVVVVVPDEHDRRAGVVERRPEGRVVVAATVLTRREVRVVPVGERAARRAGREVAAEPLLLRAPRFAAANLLAVRVERDQVPPGEIEAVIARRRIPGRLAEIAEVPCGSGGAVLVVADRGSGDRLHAPPGRLVRGREGRRRCVLVLGVTEDEHRRVVGVDEEIRRRGLPALEILPLTIMEGRA